MVEFMHRFVRKGTDMRRFKGMVALEDLTQEILEKKKNQARE